MTDNFNLFSLFITKEVKIYIDEEHTKVIRLILPSIADFYQDEDLNAAYHFWTMSSSKRKSFLNIKEDISPWVFFCTLETVYGKISNFSSFTSSLLEVMKHILPDLEINQAAGVYKVNDITITSEIWDYILYLLKLSCGEKVEKPVVAKDASAQKFLMAQKKAEERIAALRKQSKSIADDSLLKVFLRIIYAFPSLTIDYLTQQTMAQIQWLAKYAAEAPSYQINAQALAAGNMKKGKKLEFFIK